MRNQRVRSYLLGARVGHPLARGVHQMFRGERDPSPGVAGLERPCEAEDGLLRRVPVLRARREQGGAREVVQAADKEAGEAILDLEVHQRQEVAGVVDGKAEPMRYRGDVGSIRKQSSRGIRVVASLRCTSPATRSAARASSAGTYLVGKLFRGLHDMLASRCVCRRGCSRAGWGADRFGTAGKSTRQRVLAFFVYMNSFGDTIPISAVGGP